jgi:DnaK suppressor protein
MKEEVIQAIQEKIAATEKRITQLKDLCKPIAPENAIGRVSRMDAINNKSVNEAALRQNENTLLKLQQALTKVDEPNFGKCYSCGNSIPLGRILLVPQSNKCVQCASR